VYLFSTHDEAATRRARRAAAALSTSDEWHVDGERRRLSLLREKSWA